MTLMGVALLLYVVLDGYDLGVGILLPGGTDEEKDMMVGAIGPFWDANEPGWCWASASCWWRFRWRMESCCRRCTCRWSRC